MEIHHPYQPSNSPGDFFEYRLIWVSLPQSVEVRFKKEKIKGCKAALEAVVLVDFKELRDRLAIGKSTKIYISSPIRSFPGLEIWERSPAPEDFTRFLAMLIDERFVVNTSHQNYINRIFEDRSIEDLNRHNVALALVWSFGVLDKVFTPH